MIVGLDVGRNQTKVVTSNQRINFKSAVGEWRERRISSGGEYEVTINNEEKYFVSDLALDESRCRVENVSSSKIHEQTKILTLTALGLVTTPFEKLTIVMGLPISQHTLQVKSQIENLLKGNYTVKVNNKVGTFSINEIYIAPEGASTYRNLTLNQDGMNVNPIYQKTRICDIGSKTLNICTISETGKFIDRDSDTLEYGMLDLQNEEVLTESLYSNFVKRIAGDLSKKWMDFSNKDYLVFTGGGSIVLGKYLKQMFPYAKILEDSIFSNASGFYKMGVSLCRKQLTAK